MVHIILHLSLIENIGPTFIQKLVGVIGLQNLPDIYNFSLQDFTNLGMSERRAQLLVDGLQDLAMLQKELELIEQLNAKVITLWCGAYPDRLRHIDAAPPVLYLQGDVSLLLQDKMLACVGARLAHRYVQDCLNKIVVPMIQDGWVIVSGGAAGADTFAHKTALLHGGKTIAVFGSGLCYQYPEKNKPLFQEIIDSGGLIVSSFPMRTQPLQHCFPIRNRIVSGLSVGCLVLQAAIKSGALITAQFALDQGREVFAVPGPIYDPLSAGCHELIKLGAKLVTETQDILQELIPDLQPVQVQENFLKNASLSSEKLVSSSRLKSPIATVSKKETATVDESLDELERLILQYATVSISIDDLLVKVGVASHVLHDKLFMLSLDGKIEQDFTGLWKRK